MLRANTHVFPCLLHRGEHINAKKVCFSLRAINQTGKHRDGGRLSSTVVTKETEYLILVELNIETVDRLEPIVVLFIQPADLEHLLSGLFCFNLRCELLIALRIHALRLELHRLLDAIKLVLTCLHANYANFSLSVAFAAPKIGSEAEAWMEALAVGLRRHLLHVEAKKGEPDTVNAHHHKSDSNGIVIVFCPYIIEVRAYLAGLESAKHVRCLNHGDTW